MNVLIFMYFSLVFRIKMKKEKHTCLQSAGTNTRPIPLPVILIDGQLNQS